LTAGSGDTRTAMMRRFLETITILVNRFTCKQYSETATKIALTSLKTEETQFAFSMREPVEKNIIELEREKSHLNPIDPF